MKPYAYCALLALLVPPAASPQDSGRQARSPAPVKLRTGTAVTVAGGTFGTWLAFLGPLRCDPDGNVFFVPAPPFSSPPDPPALTPPNTAVRVSADGQTTTRFSLTSVPDLTDSEITATAFDTDGNPYVLAVEEGRQYIVSFTKGAKYRSKIEIDPDEMLIGSFAAFRSGEFLLAGRNPDGPLRPRVAILSSGGGSLQDVALSADPAVKKGLSVESRMRLLDSACAEPAPDGRVYLVRRTPKGPVYAVSPSAEVIGSFALLPPRPEATLSAIKISGHRLAAVYETAPASDERSSVYWIAVHDLSTGEHLAAYGPVTRMIVCYRSGQGPDRFTLLSMKNEGLQLFEASAP